METTQARPPAKSRHRMQARLAGKTVLEADAPELVLDTQTDRLAA